MTVKTTLSPLKITALALLFSAAFMLLACASPMRLTDNWRSSVYKGPAYKKIMVVALTERDDLRQPVEDEFATQLRSRGVETVACHECIPDAKKLTPDELVKAGRGLGVEAFLVVRVLRAGTDVQTYTPQTPSGPATATGTDSILNMQLFGPDLSGGKRYDVVTLESRLYDGKSTDVVWRSTVDAVNPKPSEGQISRFVRLEVNALADEKLIPAR